MSYKNTLIIGLVLILGAGIHSYFSGITYIHAFLLMLGSFLATSGFILKTESKRKRMVHTETERRVKEFIIKKREAAIMKEKRQKFKKRLLLWLFVIAVLVVLFYLLKGMVISWFKGLF